MTIYNPDQVIARTILQLIQDDIDQMDSGGLDPIVLTQVAGNGVAYYMPLDWIEKYARGFEESWGKFMYGQTYCEHGFYVSDVTRFLRSKARK